MTARAMLATTIATLAAACAPVHGRTPNIVLVSIDTLRADHLGCYGYQRATSPVIDRLAKDSTLYEQAHAAAPWTLPSHAGMLSGIHPWRLGMLNERSVIPAKAPLVAEALARAGYLTAAFVDSGPGGFVGARRGFGRGFASYRHAPFAPEGQYKYDMRATVRAADKWLGRRDAGKPFFLFLHTKSVHDTPEDSLGQSDAPYDKPREYVARFLPSGRPQFPWSRGGRVRGGRFLRDLNARITRGEAPVPALPPEQLKELIALYDAGIYYVDEQIGALLAALERRGLARDTVVIITSDHGEAFLEHRFLHHREVYEPLLHVPLIVHDPRVKQGRRLSAAVTVEDVAATILALAGVPLASQLDGRALPVSEAPSTPRSLFSYYRFKPEEGYEAYALRRGPLELVHHQLLGRPLPDELYDLARDPQERHALSADGAEARALLAEIQAWVSGAAAGESMQLDPETMQELRSLGYAE